MSRFRFSIATFLIVVTLLALGLGAMASQSRLATSVAYTAFLVLLGIATGGALLAAGPRRAFWAGFAIFGWMYWFVEFDTGVRNTGPQPVFTAISFFSGQLTTRQQPTPRTSLLTSDLMDWLESVMTANLRVGAKVTAQWRGGSYYTGTIVQTSGDGQYLIVWDDGSPQQWTPPSQILPNSPSLRLAGHATFGGLFALFGGALVTVLFGNAGRRESERREGERPGN